MTLHMPPILIYALRRLAQAIPVVILIMIGTFLLLKLAPGDTVDALVGDMGGADAAFIARLRTEYGLDQPIWVQLWRYMVKLASFDFGWSFVYEQPVSTVLMERLGTTLMLMAAAYQARRARGRERAYRAALERGVAQRTRALKRGVAVNTATLDKIRALL